jgi:hypothetical protein
MHTGTWAGRRGVGPRTTAHVLDFCQIGALRQPGPHMLGPLGGNVVVAQAGVRPHTQSVTHTDTDRENEATQGYTHTQFREARPKADTHTRTPSAHVVRSYRETDTSIHLLHTDADIHTHTERSRAPVLFLSFDRMHSHKHWHTTSLSPTAPVGPCRGPERPPAPRAYFGMWPTGRPGRSSCQRPSP